MIDTIISVSDFLARHSYNITFVAGMFAGPYIKKWVDSMVTYLQKKLEPK